MMTQDVCHLCGREEREPYTPAGFSMLMSCKRCDELTCSKCGDHDADCSGDPPEFSGSVICNLCLRKARQ
jgi:hypothetical protein